MITEKHTSEHKIDSTNIELHHYITELTPEELRDLLEDNLGSKLNEITLDENESQTSLTGQFGLLILKFYTVGTWSEECPATRIICEIHLIRAISNLPIEVINQINIELPELKLVSDSTGMKSILFLDIEYGVTGKTLINQIECNLDSVIKLTLHMFDGKSN